MKAAGISDKELQMALSLVEGMSEEWKPEKYHDTYKDDVLALVKKKVKAGQTKTITAAEPETKATKSSMWSTWWRCSRTAWASVRQPRAVARAPSRLRPRRLPPSSAAGLEVHHLHRWRQSPGGLGIVVPGRVADVEPRVDIGDVPLVGAMQPASSSHVTGTEIPSPGRVRADQAATVVAPRPLRR